MYKFIYFIIYLAVGAAMINWNYGTLSGMDLTTLLAHIVLWPIYLFIGFHFLSLLIGIFCLSVVANFIGVD